jgi:hypothetical protein
MFAGMPAIVRHAGAPPDHPLTGIPCREIWRRKTLIAGFGHEANQHTGIQYTRCINGCCAIGSSVVDRVEVVMVAAIGQRKENTVEPRAPSPSRREVLARYRHLREISKRHLSGAMKFLSQDAILHHARRLGLARGKTVILDSMDELTLAFDLAIHTAPDARSRAIDRYARSARFAPESDEALMLEAMRNARFAVVMVQRRHPSNRYRNCCASRVVRRSRIGASRKPSIEQRLQTESWQGSPTETLPAPAMTPEGSRREISATWRQ